MKKIMCVQLIFFLLFTVAAFSQTNDNAELQKMYGEDQGGRAAAPIDWAVLSRQDSLRELRVYALMREGKVITGKDYFNTAMIFQHGRDTTASGMAVRQMKKAIELDPTINRWLLAAAIDRDLMRRNKPQIYGTQFVKIGQNAKWERYTIDSTKVTDAERRYYNVESLAEQKAKERNMNLSSISSYFTESRSIDKTIELIKTEKRKGIQATYNVSEEAVNSFGYHIVNSVGDPEALKVFRLNTELYPDGSNTFDSYGECLMRLDQKEAALKAYQKSLDLNPKNENARNILEAHKWQNR